MAALTLSISSPTASPLPFSSSGLDAVGLKQPLEEEQAHVVAAQAVEARHEKHVVLLLARSLDQA